MNKEFWKGKKVLITGHSGFKGSWLCLWLNKLGAEVYGFSLPWPPTTPSLYELAKVRELISTNAYLNVYTGDITHYPTIRDAVNLFSPEIIFHMAAQTIVKEGFVEYCKNVVKRFSDKIGVNNAVPVCR